MLKQLFDISEKKGDQNKLITLSKNYGNTQTIISSGVERSINEFINFGENNDLFVQEYLANISNQTKPPNTFDMKQLLNQLPENNLNIENLEHFWINSLNISKSISLANDWTKEFNQNELNKKWMNEFISEQKNLKMENEWEKTNEGSVWAKDFLENYDLNEKQINNNLNNNYLNNNWENEFLNDFGKQEENLEFFDYESTWENYNSKEAQEKYEFNKANPFLNEENSIEKAKENLSYGRIADSILYYEAAIQKDPKNVEIWYSLGIALAENEQDPKAISALRNALKLNSKHLKSILALSVSLANESFDCLALHELNKFICIYKNCSEEEIPKDNKENTSFGFQYKKLDKNEFLKDPILWNRLGATLANADRSAEAINAYKRALQISPSYVRVRYNLGVSCMNLQSYREAAIHFLAALKIQHSPEHSLIWSRLRSAIIRMENIQLDNEIFEAINCHDLDKITKIFGFE
uniref:TPR_REGION domain-containing protein n=1 Tax=Meloidogyne hapla TaxID=6305 RepID=A0A1I8B3L5_MELHA